jgi:hypothetical protein
LLYTSFAIELAWILLSFLTIPLVRYIVKEKKTVTISPKIAEETSENGQ